MPDIRVAYGDRQKSKRLADICINFIQRDSDEQKRLEVEVAKLEEKFTETPNTILSADEFIRNIEKYIEMSHGVLGCVVIDGHPKHTGTERMIDIFYKVDSASVLQYNLNNREKRIGCLNSCACLCAGG